MKKLIYILIASILLPVTINAETYTYEICKSGCDYSSLEEIENDMKTKTDKETVIINFKDSETYEYTAEESFSINHNIKEYRDIKNFELHGNDATIKVTKNLEFGDFENVIVDNINIKGDLIRVVRNVNSKVLNVNFDATSSISLIGVTSSAPLFTESIQNNSFYVDNSVLTAGKNIILWLSTFNINNSILDGRTQGYNATIYFNNNKIKSLLSGNISNINTKLYVYANNTLLNTPYRLYTKGMNYKVINQHADNNGILIEYAIYNNFLNQGYTQGNYIYYYQDIDKTISANTNISDFEKEFINTYENSIGYDDIKDLPIEWKSENESIAKIVNGVITPVNSGKVDLVGTRGNDIYTIHLTVNMEEGIIEKKETAKENFGKADFSADNLVSVIPLTQEEQDKKEQGKDIDVFLDVKDVTKSVLEEEKALINEKISTNETLAMYLDVNLFKQVEGEEATKIEETNGNVLISFKIPEELINKNPSINRTYYILRLHDGVVDKLETTVNDNKLMFETNKFSTYALTYVDTNNPKTGDNIVIYLILGLLSIICIPVLIKKTK